MTGTMRDDFTVAEFFAGSGMARAGLGSRWGCVFANDIDPKKADAYRRNWGGAQSEMIIADVWNLTHADVPHNADAWWCSFPCQDLSLSGQRRGLAGAESSAFWPFWKLAEHIAPPLVVIENVIGLLSSRQGRDFTALISALDAGRYRYGALVMDAALFLPQSRPRLFVVAVRADLAVLPSMTTEGPTSTYWHPKVLRRAVASLPDALAKYWLWWSPPVPAPRTISIESLIESAPADVAWVPPAATAQLLAMMTPAHVAKVDEARGQPGRHVGTLYKRTRREPDGSRRLRAEVRFDGLAGCLRTAGGGASRQIVIEVCDGRVRSRLLSAREGARLMGLPDNYILPTNYTDALRLVGDGVAVPVVRHLAAHILEPTLAGAESGDRIR